LFVRFFLLVSVSFSINADDIQRLGYEGFTVWIVSKLQLGHIRKKAPFLLVFARSSR